MGALWGNEPHIFFFVFWSSIIENLLSITIQFYIGTSFINQSTYMTDS